MWHRCQRTNNNYLKDSEILNLNGLKIKIALKVQFQKICQKIKVDNKYIFCWFYNRFICFQCTVHKNSFRCGYFEQKKTLNK